MTEAAVASPAPEPAQTPEPSAEEAADDPLFDNLMTAVATATGTDLKDEPSKDAEEKPAAEDGDEKPEAKAAVPEDWDDLGDDKPWTPERHKKIREQHVADRRKISNLLSKLHDQKGKFRKKVEQFKTDRTQVDLLTRRVATDLEALRVGSAEQALDALGRLAQRDPHSLYEAMSLAMLGRGNQPKADPKLAAIEAKLEALVEGSKRGQQSREEENRIAHTQREMRTALADADSYPTLAAIAAGNPAQAIEEFEEEYVNQSRAAGRWLDVELVAGRIDRRLRKSQPLRQAQNGAAPNQGDRVQETRALAKPETAQSPPRSLSPSLAAASGGSRREQTEEELQDELVRNAPPGFFESFYSG